MPDRRADLSAWATELTGEPIREIRRRPGGGRHEAWDVVGEAGGTWFLRADNQAPADHEHYTLRRESEIYAAVVEAGLPAPSILGVHPVHEAVLMDYIEGDAKFAPLALDDQASVVADFAPLLARLHALDVDELELPSLGAVGTVADHVVRELDIWESRLDRIEVPDPFLRACFVWLRANVPVVDGPPSLVQGDTGPGNFLHDGRRVTALLDFELGHLGDPIEDLAWVGTRNAQDPVPDFDAFLAGYAAGGGADFDVDRFRYHSLFAELRIAVLGAEGRGGSGASLMGDLGSRLIFGCLHRRLVVEALCTAVGLPRPEFVPVPAADTERTSHFDTILTQMKDIVGPELTDPFAFQRLKSLARVVKYLREADRVGGETLADRELEALEALLGDRPASAATGGSELERSVRAGDVSAVDLLPLATAEVARMHQLTAPAMGVLATHHLPTVS